MIGLPGEVFTYLVGGAARSFKTRDRVLRGNVGGVLEEDMTCLSSPLPPYFSPDLRDLFPSWTDIDQPLMNRARVTTCRSKLC